MNKLLDELKQQQILTLNGNVLHLMKNWKEFKGDISYLHESNDSLIVTCEEGVASCNELISSYDQYPFYNLISNIEFRNMSLFKDVECFDPNKSKHVFNNIKFVECDISPKSMYNSISNIESSRDLLLSNDVYITIINCINFEHWLFCDHNLNIKIKLYDSSMTFDTAMEILQEDYTYLHPNGYFHITIYSDTFSKYSNTTQYTFIDKTIKYDVSLTVNGK